jgi:hypothetical protein
MELKEEQLAGVQRLERDFRGWTPEVNFFDINPRGKKRKPILVRHADKDAH